MMGKKGGETATKAPESNGSESPKQYTGWTAKEPLMITIIMAYFQYTMFALIGYVEDWLARMGWMKVPIASERGNKVSASYLPSSVVAWPCRRDANLLPIMHGNQP